MSFQVIQGIEEGGFNPLSMYGIEIGAVVRDHEIHTALEKLETTTDDDRSLECVSAI